MAQAWALVRSIIDIYFSVVYLIDNPKENTKKFNLVTFRIMHDDYKKIVKQFQTDPIISGNPNEFKEMLLSNGKYFGLSDYEMNNIDNLNKNQRLWPIPSLIIKRVSSSETQSFLKRIYDNQYSKCSDIAHYTGLGIGMSVYAQSPDSMKTQPGRFESDAVVMAIEFLTMIYSEIQIVINCGIEQDLKNIWGLLIKHNMENADSLHKKYSNFLK